MTDIELADHMNSRVLLADHCGFDSCVIKVGADLMAAMFMSAVAGATGFRSEIGSQGSGTTAEFWVVLSWA